MALTESQRRANNKYIKENYQRLAISYPKDFCALVKSKAEQQGESLAGYIRKAIEKRIAEEG